tara:strand:+ start:253 stop:573 length:321 start_codon:yes stop_codon:yes gene_type:complete
MAFIIKQNDTSPAIQATLKDANGSTINLNGAVVNIHMKSVNGVLKVDEQMTVVDADTGVVKYDWVTGDTDTVGTYYVEFQVTYADLTIETFPNDDKAVILIKPELA